MLNATIALLVCKGLMTDTEGKEFAKKVSLAVLPSDFNTSLDLIKGFLEEIEQAR